MLVGGSDTSKGLARVMGVGRQQHTWLSVSVNTSCDQITIVSGCVFIVEFTIQCVVCMDREYSH